MMKKRLLSTLLAICMVLTLLPAISISALAEPVTADYSLYLHTDGKLYKNSTLDEDITTTMAAKGAVVTDSAGTWVLTLTNFTFETVAATALRVPGNTTITVVGDNTITSTFDDAGGTFGIFMNASSSETLTINGSGSLTVASGISSAASSIGIYSYNSNLAFGGNVTINATGHNNAIFAVYTITINDTATINATSNRNGSGIQASSLIINGGTITAAGRNNVRAINNAAESGDYTVPAGYKYWTNTDADGVSGTADNGISVSGSEFVVTSSHKYAKIEYALPSNEKDIAAFTIAGQSGSSTIGSNTIEVTMPHGTVVTALTPTITVSPGASVSPTSGTAQNFTSPVTYTVTAADTTTKDYTVTVTVAPVAAPTAPQGFTATPGDGQVALSWTAPASDGGSTITDYQVSSDNGGSWIPASSPTSHAFTGLTNGTAYTFKVRAVNVAGNGAEAAATATPISGGSSSSSTGGGTTTPSNPTGSFFGGISTFEKGTNENLIFFVQKDFSLFRDVKVDGALLTRNTDYKAESSSTRITLYADYLNTLSVGSHTLVVGFTDGTSATATFTVKDAVTDEPTPWVNPFVDVNEDHWFYNNVKYVHQNGLFAGTSANTFSPYTPMTRGMVVTVLGRLAGIDVTDYSGDSFDDVDTAQWYAPYTKWAAKMGIVSGVGNNNFAPDANISRQDLAVVFNNYARAMGITLPETVAAVTFGDDASISGYATDAVAAMQKAGIVGGKGGGIFDPKGEATRAEVAAMLHRFVETVK